MKLIIVILSVSLLFGCTTMYSGKKLGAGQAEFSKDWLECKGVSINLRGYVDDDILVTCMQAKEWQISKK